MYNIQTTNNATVIWYEENGFRISFTSEHNEHPEYEKYLAWLAEGNTPEEWTAE
jgi:hypothetical protein